MTPSGPQQPRPARGRRSRGRVRRRAPRRSLASLLLVLAAAGGLAWLSRGLWQPPLPPPQLILVLGGDVDRERVAGALARRDGLPVLVSGGSNPEYAAWQFGQQGLDAARVHLDYRATEETTTAATDVSGSRSSRVNEGLASASRISASAVESLPPDTLACQASARLMAERTTSTASARRRANSRLFA